MNPILFAENEMEFRTNGLGILTDAVSCYVVEELNGGYELEMEYPIDGIHAEDIVHSRIILAKPSDDGDPEPFRIYRVSKPLAGIMTINAEHVSYQLNHIPCAPFTAESVVVAMQKLKQNAAEACPFDFYTDKTTNATYNQIDPASIRQRMGGAQGSILDVYGGEYKFNRWLVSLLAHRGTDRGVTLRYGKNITDIEQEEHIQNTITGVYPFWKSSENEVVDLPEKVVNSPSAENFPYHRTIVLDLSAEWEEAPTEAQLRSAAQAYIRKSGIGVPKVSIKVSFIALWQTEEYKNVAALERVALGDVVTIIFEKLNIRAYAKVEKTDYDVLHERYRSVEVGDGRANFVKSIVEGSNEVRKKIIEEQNFRTQAITKATKMITGASGGNIRMIFDADDDPIEQVIMDTKDIMTAQKVWRWNLGGLGYSNTGYNGEYGLAITADGAINANFITVGTLDANLLRAGVISDRKGNTTWDLENGIIESTQLQVNSTHFNLSKTGNLEATEAYLSGVVRTGSLTGYNVRLEGDSVDFLYGDTQFATIRGGIANNVRQVFCENSVFNFGSNVKTDGHLLTLGKHYAQGDVLVPTNYRVWLGGTRQTNVNSLDNSSFNKFSMYESGNAVYFDAGSAIANGIWLRGYAGNSFVNLLHYANTYLHFDRNIGSSLFMSATMYANDIYVPNGDWIAFGGNRRSVNDGGSNPTDYFRIRKTYESGYDYAYLESSGLDAIYYSFNGSSRFWFDSDGIKVASNVRFNAEQTVTFKGKIVVDHDAEFNGVSDINNTLNCYSGASLEGSYRYSLRNGAVLNVEDTASARLYGSIQVKDSYGTYTGATGTGQFVHVVNGIVVQVQ